MAATRTLEWQKSNRPWRMSSFVSWDRRTTTPEPHETSPCISCPLWAIMLKESLQMRRDRLTFAMIFGIRSCSSCCSALPSTPTPRLCPPPCHAEHSTISRSFVAAIGNTGYFELHEACARREAKATTPPARRGAVRGHHSLRSHAQLVRGEDARSLIEADATDPATTGPALAASIRPSPQALAGI